MSKNGTRIQKNLLRKLAKDERLHPSKRLLATMLLGVIEGQYPLSIIEAAYSKGQSKVNWDETKDPIKSPEDKDKAMREATTQLRDIFGKYMGGEFDDEPDTDS